MIVRASTLRCRTRQQDHGSLGRATQRRPARQATRTRKHEVLHEFAEQDAEVAARCFDAAIVTLCHPQIVAQCLAKENRPTPDELIEFAIAGVVITFLVCIVWGGWKSARPAWLSWWPPAIVPPPSRPAAS